MAGRRQRARRSTHPVSARSGTASQVATVRLFEGNGAESRHATLAVLRRAFEQAGVEFIDENGGGPGVRLRKRQRPRKPQIEGRDCEAVLVKQTA